MKYELLCDWCGKQIMKYRNDKHNFCSRQCLADYSNKSKNPDGYSDLKDFTKIGEHLSQLNRKLNPTRMTTETREKIRLSRLGTGESKTYAKFYGRHEHRIVAEEILGRSLFPNEVVHHRDQNKRNNSQENIVIFQSQSDHAKFHHEYNWFISELKNLEGGDAE